MTKARLTRFKQRLPWESKPRSKYNSKKVRVDEMTFDSQAEAEYYANLKLKVRAGVVKFFLRQVPFDLVGGVKYRVDFVEFWPDGSVHFIDVKGMKTDMYILKKKQVEDLYPIKIEER